MASKQHYIRVTVSESAKKKLEDQSSELGQSQTETLSRLIEWFAGMDRDERLTVLRILQPGEKIVSDKKR